jgi:spore germination protein GerM
MKSTFLLLLLLLIAVPSCVLAQKMDVKIYLENSQKNNNPDECGNVFAVTRKLPQTKAVAKAALEELFKGVTPDEKSKGYESLFSEESKSILIGVNIKNDAAYVNLSKDIKQSVSGASTSCGSNTFFAQVEETLKQFPTVKNVYYAIEGKPQDFYDWVQIGECPKELGNCCGKEF